MAALNAAFMSDGAYIYLPDDAVIEDPVHLLFITTNQDEPLAVYPRVFVEAGANTRLTVVESYGSRGESQNLTNTLTEIVAQAQARIEHYKIQRESVSNYHLGKVCIEQGRGAQIISYSIALGAALARNDIAVRLGVEGAAVTLNGLYMVRGRQHVDHHTRIDHLSPHTSSEEFYRGVLDGYARAVFNGKVVVHEGAQKTDARQANQNLLLSRNAEVDTKPELQIYANDVKCSHGATVGSLDENALFYLRSRGINQDTARSLLTYAFAEEVLKGIGLAPIRACLENIITPSLTLPLIKGMEGAEKEFV
jgi:Fe-S cluster assembly protein SufD